MNKRVAVILLLILIPNLILRAYRLDYADGAIFDEKAYYLEAARSYLENRNDPNFEHPPLGKMLIALGIKVFGDNPYGWRASSLVFSLIGIVLTWWLAGRVFGGLFIPIVSTALMSLDNLYFVHSRLAVLEMFFLVFVLGSFLFLWRFYSHEGRLNLFLTSLFFGLALVTKWTAVLFLPAILLFLILGSRSRFWGILGIFFLVAGVVYAAAYFPYIQRNSFWQFVALQQTIILFWQNFSGKVEYSIVGYFLTHAPSWVLNPPWSYDIRESGGRLGIVYAMFNPAAYWVSLFFVVKTIVGWKKHLDRRHVFLILPVLLNFLPWIFIKRIEYLYYFLSSLPFMCLITASYLEKAFVSGSNGRYKVAWFIMTAAALFIYFYPMMTSLPVSKRYFSPITAGDISATYIESGSSSRIFTVR